MSRYRWILGLAALATLSAGCGTTVKTATGGGGGSGGNAGLSATSPGGSGSSSTTAPGAIGAALAGTSAGGGTGSAVLGGSGGTGASSGPSSPGGGSFTAPGKPTGVTSALTPASAPGVTNSTNVIIQDGADGVWAGDGLTLEWMDQAKSQDYYPRYGENGLNNPGTSLNPSDEQNNLLAVSQIDYDPSYDQGIRANPARTFCFQLEAQAGYPVSTSNAGDEVAASEACDYVFFLQRVINALPRVTAAAFVQEAQALGTSFATSEV